MKRRKGFTLIEVLAALGLIIVLTLTLVVTIRAQLEQANSKQLEATVASVNTQIEVAYASPSATTSTFASVDALVKANIITAAQQKALASGATYVASDTPPRFAVK
ncbi:prepilin-type N-terminal cleavage/methylation domain-containing protein [Lacticaseibacillus parakribbianus]|uniref:prepilin-type N-terminal cleavage/methylation domain-containing protein n=1 Tax=Lacticaseibacillus parakribbianus TaxID=2970927 RepID=UPI0021CB21AB|nr:prepilin-type N-terminal cleavage/methylation domain-containing protein [Lacticaseibacillus parakribbianus]